MRRCGRPGCRRAVKLLKCDVPPWDAAADSVAATAFAAQFASMGKAALNLTFAIGILAASTPAWAGGSTPIPEPTDITLLAMGLAGLIIGRRAAKKPPKD